MTKTREKNDEVILMGCPYHMAHNAARCATEAFKQNIKFNSEEPLAVLYFHFDFSSKRKNLLLEFCDFCNQDFYKILKFYSVRWLGLATCIERTLKLNPSRKSYFFSQNPEIKDGGKTVPRLTTLIDAIGNIMMTEVGIFVVDIFHLRPQGIVCFYREKNLLPCFAQVITYLHKTFCVVQSEVYIEIFFSFTVKICSLFIGTRKQKLK